MKCKAPQKANADFARVTSKPYLTGIREGSPTIQSELQIAFSDIPQFASRHVWRANRALLNDVLEVKTQLGGVTPWRYEVCAAKGGQEIVERNLVGDVYGRQPQAPLVFVSAKNVVVSHCDIKQVTRGNTRRIVVVILRSRRRNRDSC